MLKKGKYKFFKSKIRNITYHLFVEYFHFICWEIDSDTKVVQKKCYFFLICSLDRFQDCELKCSHPPTMKNLKLIILIFLNLTKKIYILNAIFGSSKLILIKIWCWFQDINFPKASIWFIGIEESLSVQKFQYSFWKKGYFLK